MYKRQEMEAHEDIIGIVRTYDDIRRNWEQGRMSAPVSYTHLDVYKRQIT